MNSRSCSTTTTVFPACASSWQRSARRIGVARVQPDRRLVQHVERAHELRAELVGQVDPLRLAAGQCPRLPGEREVAETHAQEEGELGIELAQDLAGDDVLPGAETEVAEETGRGVDRERGELGDGEPGDADRQRGGLEPRAAADLATDWLR